MDEAEGASGEVTYALRVCGGARLVVEARWHAGGAAFDVKVTDGVCLWRKEGVSAPPSVLTATLTLGEWMAAARAALGDESYDHVSFTHIGVDGRKLSWTWMQRSVNVEHKSNTGAEELRSSAAAPAAIFDMLCGAAQHAASAAAESSRCVAAAAALREELQRTAAEAAWATAAKLATEQEQLQKFALVLNEKKKKVEDVQAALDDARNQLEEAQQSQAWMKQDDHDDGGSGLEPGGSGLEPGGSSGSDGEAEAMEEPPQPQQAPPPPPPPQLQPAAPMETSKPAAFGKGSSRVKQEQPAGAAAAPQPGGGASQARRAAPVSALAHIQQMASLAPKDEFDTADD